MTTAYDGTSHEAGDWSAPPVPPAAPRSPEPPQRHRPTGWIAAVVVALLVGAGGGFAIGHSTASGPNKPKAPKAARTVVVKGTFTLTDPTGFTDDVAGGNDAAGDLCSGGVGYGDINSGTEVVISDDAGRTLQITSLGQGSIDADGGCAFPFSTTVPSGLKFYGITVSHRGTVKESEAELGSVALTLGN